MESYVACFVIAFPLRRFPHKHQIWPFACYGSLKDVTSFKLTHSVSLTNSRIFAKTKPSG
jgi:hypothetical protein